MENATEVIHTTHHSHVLIEEVVLNKEAVSIDFLDHYTFIILYVS